MTTKLTSPSHDVALDELRLQINLETSVTIRGDQPYLRFENSLGEV